MLSTAVEWGMRRLPHGRRGLKFFRGCHCVITYFCRLPHGRRGLKYHLSTHFLWFGKSPSTRKAWIEIRVSLVSLSPACSRLPHGRRGLKCLMPANNIKFALSPSTRKAWIEMSNKINCSKQGKVAFHTEGVD